MAYFEEKVKFETNKFFEHFLVCLKWIGLALFTGVVLGLIATAFAYGLSYATEFRLEHKYVIFSLPLIGLVIVYLYEKFGSESLKGTNSVIASVNSNDKVHFAMTPLIFISSILSHFAGASVGREGAALQMGASMGHTLGKALKLNENDEKVLMMTGMSAAFAALFGTPLAAAIFAMEVISVGIMHYAALVPCIVSALTAFNLAKYLGVSYASYSLTDIPDFTPFTVSMTMILGLLFAMVSILICVSLALSERGFQKHFKNPYIKVLVTSVLLIALTFIVGSQDYNGLGTAVIMDAISGNVIWYAFILKIIFTAISLSGGYKGGEIVPVLFIGATFGCFIGPILGMSPEFCAALGMIAVFCGVTNSPISSIIIGIELFGTEGLWFFCLVVALSYMLSGYFGIYKSQLIVYSKYKSEYVKKSVKR